MSKERGLDQDGENLTSTRQLRSASRLTLAVCPQVHTSQTRPLTFISEASSICMHNSVVHALGAGDTSARWYFADVASITIARPASVAQILPLGGTLRAHKAYPERILYRTPGQACSDSARPWRVCVRRRAGRERRVLRQPVELALGPLRTASLAYRHAYPRQR